MRIPVPPDVYTRAYYLSDREGSAEFVASRGQTLCAQHANALALAGIQRGHVVLDVGCGCGELACQAAVRGARALWGDQMARVEEADHHLLSRSCRTS